MNLHYYYDQEADMLYFSKGKPSARDTTQETSDDIVIRLNSKTGKIVGFTILNFAKRSRKPGRSIKLPIEAELTPAR